MKKTTFLSFVALFLFNSVNAQVLWSENFESYTLGNVGTDPTATVPGKGNWYSGMAYPFNDVVNENFRIEHESGRGKYIIIKSTMIDERGVYNENYRFLHKSIANILSLKDPTNNIIKLELEYNYHFSSFTTFSMGIGPNSTYYHSIGMISDDNGSVTEHYLDDKNSLPYLLITPKNWYKTILYLDLDNNDSYIEFPSMNYAIKSTDKTGSYPYNLFTLNQFSITLGTDDNFYDSSFLKIDNIKISAINTLPTLNIIDLDASKFNLYPNPATNILYITNSENISVKQVEIYDATGKLINTQNFNNEAEIQLNVETLTS